MLNETFRCLKCGEPVPPHKQYCTLRCRDAAKLARRREREQRPPDTIEARTETAPASLVLFPDSDQETLSLFAEQYVSGSLTEPTYFAAPAGRFNPPAGVEYSISPSGIGCMRKI